VVSFTPRPFYPQGKSPRYPFDRRLGGAESQSRRRGEEKKPFPRFCRESNPGSPARKLVAIPKGKGKVVPVLN
jgi:hypothetical protein